MNNEEKKRVISEQKFGMPIEMLGAEQIAELEAEFMSGIYDDYDSKEDLLAAQRSMGEELMMSEAPGMIDAGGSGLVFANVGGGIGNLAKMYGGKRLRDKAEADMGALSKQKAEALALAGQVAREDADKGMKREDDWRDKFLNAMVGGQQPQGGPPQGGPPQGGPLPGPVTQAPPQGGPLPGPVTQAPPQGKGDGGFMNDMHSMMMQGTPQNTGAPPQGGFKSQIPTAGPPGLGGEGGMSDDEKLRKQRAMAASMRGY